MGICAIIVDNSDSSFLRFFAISRVAGFPLIEKIYVLTDRKEEHLDPKVVFVQVASTICKNYNSLMLGDINEYIDDKFSHFLVFQWDGFPCRYELWEDEFLNYDYIGAPWPVAGSTTDHIVGNGGFSLRSRRLYSILNSIDIKKDYVDGTAEDAYLCINKRDVLEASGVRFPPIDLAARFSRESQFLVNPCFGFHGLHNLPLVLSVEELALAFNEILARSPSLTSTTAISTFFLLCCYERKHLDALRSYFSNSKNQEAIGVLLDLDHHGAHGYRPGIFRKFLHSEGVLK